MSLDLPVIERPLITHIGVQPGTLKKSQYGRTSSMEGHTLSVSDTPGSWQSIGSLGGRWWIMRGPGRFVDMHEWPDEERQAALGARPDLVVPGEPVWAVEELRNEWSDETQWVPYESEAEAREEAAVQGSVVKTFPSWKPTAALIRRAGAHGIQLAPNGDGTLAALIEIVQEHGGFDGLWWDDILDAADFSAPRGALFHESIPRWEVRLISEDEEWDADAEEYMESPELDDVWEEAAPVRNRTSNPKTRGTQPMTPTPEQTATLASKLAAYLRSVAAELAAGDTSRLAKSAEFIRKMRVVLLHALPMGTTIPPMPTTEPVIPNPQTLGILAGKLADYLAALTPADTARLPKAVDFIGKMQWVMQAAAAQYAGDVYVQPSAPAAVPTPTGRALSGHKAQGWIADLRARVGADTADFYQELREAITNNVIGPTAVVGGGLRNPKKAALEHIDGKLAKLKLKASAETSWPTAAASWDAQFAGFGSVRTIHGQAVLSIANKMGVGYDRALREAEARGFTVEGKPLPPRVVDAPTPTTTIPDPQPTKADPWAGLNAVKSAVEPVDSALGERIGQLVEHLQDLRETRNEDNAKSEAAYVERALGEEADDQDDKAADAEVDGDTVEEAKHRANAAMLRAAAEATTERVGPAWRAAFAAGGVAAILPDTHAALQEAWADVAKAQCRDEEKEAATAALRRADSLVLAWLESGDYTGILTAQDVDWYDPEPEEVGHTPATINLIDADDGTITAVKHAVHLAAQCGAGQVGLFGKAAREGVARQPKPAPATPERWAVYYHAPRGGDFRIVDAAEIARKVLRSAFPDVGIPAKLPGERWERDGVYSVFMPLPHQTEPTGDFLDWLDVVQADPETTLTVFRIPDDKSGWPGALLRGDAQVYGKAAPVAWIAKEAHRLEGPKYAPPSPAPTHPFADPEAGLFDPTAYGKVAGIHQRAREELGGVEAPPSTGTAATLDFAPDTVVLLDGESYCITVVEDTPAGVIEQYVVRGPGGQAWNKRLAHHGDGSWVLSDPIQNTPTLWISEIALSDEPACPKPRKRRKAAVEPVESVEPPPFPLPAEHPNVGSYYDAIVRAVGAEVEGRARLETIVSAGPEGDPAKGLAPYAREIRVVFGSTDADYAFTLDGESEVAYLFGPEEAHLETEVLLSDDGDTRSAEAAGAEIGNLMATAEIEAEIEGEPAVIEGETYIVPEGNGDLEALEALMAEAEEPAEPSLEDLEAMLMAEGV